MATGKPGPKREVAPETGLEPEYTPNECRFEAVGNGNIRVYAYGLRHGELRLLFTCLVAAAELAIMGRQALHAGADGHNLEMWESDGPAGH
jgi:hypothetical protein